MLKPHPGLAFPEDLGIEAVVERVGANGLLLNYQVASVATRIRVPPVTASVRADRLWEHTCFEAFVQSGEDDGYCELNFSPSTQWAAYRFDKYRSGGRDADIGNLRIDLPENRDAFELRVDVEGLPPGSAWRIGLSAVIEEKSGNKSYWALAHPPGRPDFHHPTCFALELPAAEGP